MEGVWVVDEMEREREVWVPAFGDLCITAIPAKAGIQNPMI